MATLPRNKYAPPPPRSPRGPFAFRNPPIGLALVVNYIAEQPEPDIPDVSPPTVANFVPEPGTPLALLQAISFDVTDNEGFGRVLVMAKFRGVAELVHDSATFAPGYSGSMVPITGGHRFTIRRARGWSSPPTISVYAIDHNGNEAMDAG